MRRPNPGAGRDRVSWTAVRALLQGRLNEDRG